MEVEKKISLMLSRNSVEILLGLNHYHDFLEYGIIAATEDSFGFVFFRRECEINV